MTAIVTEPSICIPRALANVTWKDVKDVFEKLIGTGSVERVDLVKSHDNGVFKFCRIFIHFRTWPVHNAEVAQIRDRLIAGETIKLVYNNPWFWKCMVSNIPKPERNRERHDPFILGSKPIGEETPCLRTLDHFEPPTPLMHPLPSLEDAPPDLNATPTHSETES